jgi:general secretion pathway protein M
MSPILRPAAIWWRQRTPREHRMLLVMAALFLATGVWLGVVRPVLDWRTAAGLRAAAAAATLGEVRAAVAALRPQAPAAGPAEGLEPLVRRTAEAAGLDIVPTMSASGQLGVQVSQVRSGPLFAWLSGLETDHRLLVCSLGVVENADATLAVEVSLSAVGCGG